jgi:hypothetical protein
MFVRPLHRGVGTETLIIIETLAVGAWRVCHALLPETTDMMQLAWLPSSHSGSRVLRMPSFLCELQGKRRWIRLDMGLRPREDREDQVLLKPQSAQSHLSSFRTSSWAGCVLGFWWFPIHELHVYSSTCSEAEALSEYGVVTE